MRAVLTGAAGFIGSHLARRLLSEGWEIVGVDNFSTGQRRHAEELSRHPRFTFVEADVCEPLAVEGPLDWVLHFASPASPPKYLAMPIETMRANAEGTRFLLDLAVEKGAKFFLASTSEVYGDPLVHPQPETYNGNVRITGPRAVYDEGKRYAEALTLAYHRAKGLSVRIARIFNTYGPGMDLEDGRVITNFIAQALRGEPLTVYGDGSQTRSFCYVDDLVEGIRRLMEVEYCEPVNLGNPEEHRVLEVAELVRELTGAASGIEFRPLPVDDPRRRRPDTALVRRLSGWEPRVSLRVGLSETVRFFRQLTAGLCPEPEMDGESWERR